MRCLKSPVTLLRTAVALLFTTAFLCRCATIGSPTGGPKDSLPPVIINLTPDNFSTNRPLTGHDRILIEFDEFVQIKDQQKEFFTSPAMKKKPLITLKGKGIVVQLRDTLEPNTTYALNFGGSIRDNNENNPLNAMRYVFSTGPEVDSMIVSGYTADSYKADSVSKSFIWFFAADSVEQVIDHDSTLFKYKPDAIARAENNGIFIAQNLKPIPYRVYAIQDKNDNQMYEPGSDQVGFLGEVVNPAEQPDFAIWYDSLRLYPSAEPQLYFRMFTDRAFRRQVLQESKRPLQHKAELFFSAERPEILSLKFDSIPSDSVLIEPVTQGRDTLNLWFNISPEALPDTIKGEMIYLKHDTANILRPDTVELKLAAPSEQKIIQEISAGNIAITDAKGNSLEWSLSEKESIRGVAKGVTVFKIHTVPQGDWVEIKGDLKAQVSGDIITHPAQSVKMGEKGKLNIPGLDITVEWDKDDELELSTTGKQSRAIADCSFKTPSGAEAEILHSSTMSGMNEVSLGYGFEDGIKEVSVIMKTYGEPKTVTVPVHKRIGFSGELKAE